MLMENRARMLDRLPSLKEFEGINNCRRAAWEKNGKNYYPYAAFGNFGSWQENGELGRAIQKKQLFVCVARDGQENIVAHAALVRNKYGVELGRVFASSGGHGYGIAAVEGLREFAEKSGINEIHMGVSYNRTAMWRAFEESFGSNAWKLAILGILPDIYQEHDMQWGEILSRAVKGKKLQFPPVPVNMPAGMRNFVEGIQAYNSHVAVFGKAERRQKPLQQPYPLANNVVALDWNDNLQQDAYARVGYRPVGIVPLEGIWRIIVFKGNFPQRIEGIGKDLQQGRNPIIYPRVTNHVQMSQIIGFIYNQ